MFQNMCSNKVIIIVVALILVFCSMESFARGPKRRPPIRVAPYPPASHRPLVFKGVNFFFHGGIFFRKGPLGYIAVKAPVGVVIASLPKTVEIVVLGGETYYRHNGIYYREVLKGYIVVERPDIVVVEQDSDKNQDILVTNKVIVTTAKLNVRSGPGKDHPVIHEVHKDDTLVVHGNAPGWLYVELPKGKYGWVVDEFTIPEVPPSEG